MSGAGSWEEKASARQEHSFDRTGKFLLAWSASVLHDNVFLQVSPSKSHRAAASNGQGPAGLQGMHPVNSPLFRLRPHKPQLARTVTWHPDTFHRETHLEVFYKNLSQLERKPSAPLLLLEEGPSCMVWVSGRAARSANPKFWHR